jgi:sugar phosphate permease
MSRPPSFRWVVLAIGTLSQASACTFVFGLPLLVPALRREEHLSLVGATVVVSAPTTGLLLTLVAWGAAADRWGERVVMASGGAAATVLLLLAVVTHGPVLLCVFLALAGAMGACLFAASGRVVIGWFPREGRGLAMGVRQTAQPLGVAIAGVGLPLMAHRWDVHVALLLPAALVGASTVAILTLLVDPPRTPLAPGVVAANPYRGSRTLLRVHTASTLLVVPQMAVAAFTAVYLVSQRHWAAVDAGRLVASFQLVGAAGRILSGIWSDRVGSRMRPMRQLAVLAALLMALISLGAGLGVWWIVPVFGVAAVVTVADNGLAYTSVAEIAGSSWSGRALGLHNTIQNVASVVTAPLMALVIGESHYALAFALIVVAPLLAVVMTPVGAEDWVPGQDGVSVRPERAELGAETLRTSGARPPA